LVFAPHGGANENILKKYNYNKKRNGSVKKVSEIVPIGTPPTEA